MWTSRDIRHVNASSHDATVTRHPARLKTSTMTVVYISSDPFAIGTSAVGGDDIIAERENNLLAHFFPETKCGFRPPNPPPNPPPRRDDDDDHDNIPTTTKMVVRISVGLLFLE